MKKVVIYSYMKKVVNIKKESPNPKLLYRGAQLTLKVISKVKHEPTKHSCDVVSY